MIEFTWGGFVYVLPQNAVGAKAILLPDYILLTVARWENNPVKPVFKGINNQYLFFKIEHISGNPRLSLEAVAHVIKGCVIATRKES